MKRVKLPGFWHKTAMTLKPSCNGWDRVWAMSETEKRALCKELAELREKVAAYERKAKALDGRIDKYLDEKLPKPNRTIRERNKPGRKK